MAHATDIRVARTSLIERFTAHRAELVTRIKNYRTYRTTVNELSDLSDRELADLGLTRSMIRGIAYNAAYGC